MNNFDKMNTLELEKKLQELKESLEEVKEERKFVLNQTGIHLPGVTVQKYEAEIKEIKQNINTLKALLQRNKKNI
ncbi:hypothetical protein ACFHWD_19030 [Clostridium sp. MT-14]|uniref:50S ribosomal protein L29 n=1 Tax=Clostridium aromativorans TaxID=2836848 RepID=A0ABS8N7G9_9CLOT|nr:hypothetical protein [Clostridium aromativorans]MCC9295124.1 hypothetical protein [Clostridium aromativorans]